MEQISVIGCGNMGSALIQALANQGISLQIWNRTAAKAHALVRSNVKVADSFHEALIASSVIMFCLSDSNYETATTLLQNEQNNITGKTIIQLSSGKPQNARTLSEYVVKTGGTYIDGGIMVHPSSIGSSHSIILFSGNQVAFQTLEPVLSFLGQPIFQGEDPGAAATLDLALNIGVTPTVVALLQGFKICQLEGIQPEIYTDFIKEVFPEYIPSILDKVLAQASSTLPQVKSEETVALMAGFTKLLANYLRSLQIDSGMFDALHRLYAGGVAAGKGEHDSLCVADLHAIDGDK